MLGETDSEVVFFVLLTELSGYGPLTSRLGADELIRVVNKTIERVRTICDSGEAEPALLTFIITDGVTLAATQGGKDLYYSTYKTHCADRDDCPHLSPECEAPTETGFINHLLFSSEVIKDDNVWDQLQPGEIVGVDWRMKLSRRAQAAAPPSIID